jgi:nitroreductase
VELREGITTTGTVRRYRDQSVDRQVVVDILNDARFAPSGGNRQPWRVAIVEDVAIRHGIAESIRPIWDEYIAASAEGQTPFNPVDYVEPAQIPVGAPSDLLEQIDTIPVVLAIAADLHHVALMDGDLDRPSLTGGASIYPFCWNILLAARSRGLGGVLTTFLSREEPTARELLGLREHQALAAVLFIGVPEHQPTKLSRRDAVTFTTVDRFDAVTLERG